MIKLTLSIKITIIALLLYSLYFAITNFQENIIIAIVLFLNAILVLTFIFFDFNKRKSFINQVSIMEKESQNQIGFLITDKKGKTLAIGATFKKLTLYDSSLNNNFFNWITKNLENKKDYLIVTDLLASNVKKDIATNVLMASNTIGHLDLNLNFLPLPSYNIFKVSLAQNDLNNEMNDFLMNLPAGFFVANLDGNIISANDNFFKLINISRDDFIKNKKRFNDFVVEREELKLDDITFWEEGTSGRVKIVPVDAPPFWVWLFQNTGKNMLGKTSYIRAIIIPEVASSEYGAEVTPTLWKSPTPTVLIDDKLNIIKSNEVFKNLTKIPGAKKISEVVRSDISLEPNTTIETKLRNDVNVKISIVQKDKKTKLLFLEDQSAAKHNEHLKKHSIIALMTGSIAHNFNNILQAIMGLAEDLESKYPTNSAELQNARLIIGRAKSASNLIKRMMNIAKNKEVKLELVELNEEISEIKDTTLKYILGENIHINITRSTKLLYTKLDKIQLLEILTNLISNAKDSMLHRTDNVKHGRNINIVIQKFNNPADKPLIFGALPAGEYNLVKVSDEGEGIARDKLKVIFEPLYSTKGDKGTGFGLSSVKQNLTEIGAYIDVESKLGIGTTFFMYFKSEEAPMEINTALSKAQIKSDKTIVPKNSRIMIVDDEDGIRTQLARFFEKQGFSVLSESNGNTALLKLKEVKVDLIVTDESMPGMYGHELIKLAHKEFPHIKSVLISGYDETTLGLKNINITKTAFLSKPFMFNELLEVVNNLLSKD